MVLTEDAGVAALKASVEGCRVIFLCAENRILLR